MSGLEALKQLLRISEINVSFTVTDKLWFNISLAQIRPQSAWIDITI